MIRKNNVHIYILIGFFVFTNIMSQHFVIEKTDHNVLKYIISTIDSVTFSLNNSPQLMSIYFITGTKESIEVNQIVRIYYDTILEEYVVHEGQIYHVVQIGNQKWLKENLNIGIMLYGNNPNTQTQSNNNIVEKYCYSNDVNSCSYYGGLYTWNEAMKYVTNEKAQGICPNGWHIPSLSDFQLLVANVSNEASLKEIGEGNGTNSSGFSALLGGYFRDFGEFFDRNKTVLFWSSTWINNENSYYMYLYLGIGFDHYLKGDAYYVRCIKN